MKGVPLLAALVLLVAGCASLGAPTAADAERWARPAAPELPDPVSLAPGELTARTAGGAEFAWVGVAPRGPVLGAHLAGVPVGPETSVMADLELPAGVALLVEAELAWTGRADLDLLVRDGGRVACSSGPGAATFLATFTGGEACRAFVDAGPARAWTIEVRTAEGAAEEVPFEVAVRVSTFVAPPRYDLAAGPAGRAEVPHATLAGPYEPALAEYDFGAMAVQDRVTQRASPVRVLGVVHFPADGEGPFPLLVFLHGRGSSCETALTGGLGVPCRGAEPAATPIRSYRGYDEPAALLASHGYVVASIDANDINALDSPPQVPRGDDGMDARAALILRTLDELRGVHERGGAPMNPALDALRGRIDLARLGLMGHSRGAEAVTRAPSYAEEQAHWSAGSFLAIYSLAGTTRPGLPDYLTAIVRAPIAYAAVSPYCDGDVWTLGNYDFFDVYRALPDRGPLVNLLFMGANHNYYNSAWADDDAIYRWSGDPYCGPDEGSGRGYGRLAPEDQRRQQLVYLPAFFRLHIGGEGGFAPLFTGDAAPPAAACPAALASCANLVHVSFQPAPDAMLSLEDAGRDGALAQNVLGGASTFTGFTSARWCDPRASEPDDPCARPRALGNAARLRLAWSEDAAWRTEIPEDDADLRAYDTLALRIGLDFADDAPPDGWPARITVVLEDSRGRRAEVELAEHSSAAFPPPGLHARRITLDQARIPLDAFARVDLARIAAVELRFDGATPGAAHVADLALMDLRG